MASLTNPDTPFNTTPTTTAYSHNSQSASHQFVISNQSLFLNHVLEYQTQAGRQAGRHTRSTRSQRALPTKPASTNNKANYLSARRGGMGWGATVVRRREIDRERERERNRKRDREKRKKGASQRNTTPSPFFPSPPSPRSHQSAITTKRNAIPIPTQPPFSLHASSSLPCQLAK